MFDYVIVGAGVMGLLLSRSLARTGASVCLLEKQHCGKESSWAGGGIVSPLYPWNYSTAITALTANVQQEYARLSSELAETTGIDPEYNPCGLLMLDRHDEDVALAWAQNNNRPMEEFGPEEIYHQEPALADGFSAGLYMSYVGNVRNPRLLQALLAELKTSSRVDVREGQGECWPDISTDGTCQVKTANDTIRGRKIVFTTGAWTGDILEKSAGIRTGIRPVHGQMLVFEPGDALVTSIVLYEGRYLIPRNDGRILVGSTLEDTGFEKKQTVGARQLLLQCATTMVPELASRRIEKHWSGLRPGSVNGIPVMGKVPDTENLYVCAGHFRNGLVLAPASVRFMKDLLEGRPGGIDPEPYSLPRE